MKDLMQKRSELEARLAELEQAATTLKAGDGDAAENAKTLSELRAEQEIVGARLDAVLAELLDRELAALRKSVAEDDEELAILNEQHREETEGVDGYLARKFEGHPWKTWRYPSGGFKPTVDVHANEPIRRTPEELEIDEEVEAVSRRRGGRLNRLKALEAVCNSPTAVR